MREEKKKIFHGADSLVLLSEGESLSGRSVGRQITKLSCRAENPSQRGRSRAEISFPAGDFL